MKSILRKTLSLLLAFILTAGAAPSALAGALILPSQLNSIEESAFEGDWSLDEVTLPEGLKTIGKRAFADSSLARINLPESLNEIAADAFDETGNVDFEVREDTYAYDWLRRRLNPTVQATVLDCYTLTWWDTLAPEGTEYTVSAWLDEACTELYLTRTTLEDGMNFNTDVGTRYWFTVEYTDARGLTFRSDPGTADPIPPLEAPKNLTLTLQEDGTVVPDWDAVPGAQGYRMYYTRTAQTWSRELDQYAFEGGPENADASLLRLEEGETLFFWVCADNGDGPNLRAFSRITRPEAPLIQCAAETIYTDVYHIFWEPLDGASDYTVLTYTDESCEHLYLSSPAEENGIFLHTDVGTPYWFVLQYARNGKTFRSEPVTSEPMEILPAPENVRAEADDYGFVQLSWDPVPDATGYRLYTSTETDQWSPDLPWTSFAGPIEEGTFGLLRVDYGEVLRLWLCADNGMGPCAMTYAMVSRESSPFLRAEALNVFTDCYDISWIPINGVTDYTVRVFTGENCEQLYRSVDVTGAQAFVYTDVGTKYWFTVECERDGELIRSEPVTADPMEILPAPENFTAEADETGEIHLHWDPVPGATGYRLYSSTETDTWSPDLAWTAFEGPIEQGTFGELRIEGGQTMSLWLCADNGTGPNARSFFRVYRKVDFDAAAYVFDENNFTILDLLIELPEYTPISEEGVTDPEKLSAIRQANTFASDMIARVNEYNDSVYALNDAALGIASTVKDNGGGLAIDTGDFSFSITSGAAEAMGREFSIENVAQREDGSALLTMRYTDGGTFFIILDEGEMRLGSAESDAIPKGAESNPAPGRSPGLFAKSSELSWESRVSLFTAGYGTADGLVKGCVALWKSDGPGVIESLNLCGLSGDASFFSSLGEKILPARVAALEGLGKIMNIAGVGASAVSIAKDFFRLTEINDIEKHGHPNSLEKSSAETMTIISEMEDVIFQLQVGLTADIACNAGSAVIGIAGIAGTSFGGPVISAVANLGLAAASYALTQNNDANYTLIMEHDGMLHYVVTGTVKDKETGLPLSGVTVQCVPLNENSPHEVMTTTTDSSGVYVLEPLVQEAELRFSKEDYRGDSAQVFLYRDEQKTEDMTLEPVKHQGTVTGIVYDADTHLPLEGVTVSCGLLQKVTGVSGSFSFRVPSGEGSVAYSKEGYLFEQRDFVLEDGQVKDLSIELQPYDPDGKVSGTVTDESTGLPIQNAMIQYGKERIWTDASGQFEITLPAGYVTLTYSCYLKYRTKTREIVILSGRTIDGSIALTPVSPEEIGTVSGTVYDEDGGTLGNVDVTIDCFTVNTHKDGKFSMEVPSGTYPITFISKTGICSDVSSTVTVRGLETTPKDTSMPWKYCAYVEVSGLENGDGSLVKASGTYDGQPVYTDPEGKAKVVYSKPGEHTVSIHATRYISADYMTDIPSQTFEVWEGQRPTLHFDMLCIKGKYARWMGVTMILPHPEGYRYEAPQTLRVTAVRNGITTRNTYTSTVPLYWQSVFMGWIVSDTPDVEVSVSAEMSGYVKSETFQVNIPTPINNVNKNNPISLTVRVDE